MTKVKAMEGDGPPQRSPCAISAGNGRLRIHDRHCMAVGPVSERWEKRDLPGFL